MSEEYMGDDMETVNLENVKWGPVWLGAQPKPTLQCRIFGHDWVPFLERSLREVMKVCERCDARQVGTIDEWERFYGRKAYPASEGPT